jgi:anthraniloyl-CoA monooxygenase
MQTPPLPDNLYSTMKICIVGGGPAGLYFAILMKKLDPSHRITVVERDGPNDTFGWGIVFSDQTFNYLESNDDVSFRAITASCQTWDNVDVVHRGEKITIRGNKFSGIGRLAFLNILHSRCLELGVGLEFNTNVTVVEDLLDSNDLVVGADGANSIVRRAFAGEFGPTVELRRNKYIWLGTHQLFDALTLTFRTGPAGPFAAHSYKFNATTSTFIVECSEETWERSGLGDKTEQETCEYLARIFEDDLNGNALLSNNFVRWLNFPLVRNRQWHHRNVVLLGDALHTAHFSIGSGTKLALEDAIALADCFKPGRDLTSVLAEFQQVRKPIIDEYQDAAYSSLLLFENLEEEMTLPPIELAYKLMTRSKKIGHEKLRMRDPDFVAAYDRWREQSKLTDSPHVAPRETNSA